MPRTLPSVQPRPVHSLRPAKLWSVAVTGAVAGCALLLSGCGGSSGTDTTGTSGAAASATSTSGAGSFQAYTNCLRENGVTMPTRSPGAQPSGQPSGPPNGGPGPGGGGTPRVPDGVDPDAFAKAQQACASLRPTGGPGGGFGGNNAAFTAYRSCLTDHGVTLPTGRPTDIPTVPPTGQPTGNPGGGRGGFPGGLNTADPKVAAALKACQALLPTSGATPSP